MSCNGAGVMNLISGDGETGALLAAHMDIDHISPFTRSVRVGRKVAQQLCRVTSKVFRWSWTGKAIVSSFRMQILISWSNGVFCDPL